VSASACVCVSEEVVFMCNKNYTCVGLCCCGNESYDG
jgi:hypothetical protein